MRKVFPVLVAMALVLALGLSAYGATQTFTNSTNGSVTGIRVAFSASVRIASYDRAIFPTQSPSAEAREFTFSGGELQAGGRFKLSWADEEATIESYEWLEGSSSSLSSKDSMAFGIDYSRPELYLVQGDQTRISNPASLDWLRAKPRGLSQLKAVYAWLREFETYRAGGATIGKATVDELLASHRLSGCHDFALVFAAVARELGYPAVMVDTASIDWIGRFQRGEQGSHVGHVFVEVYLTDRWILVDSTSGAYVERGYDPANPVFRETQSGHSVGYYVMFKGIDTNAYGIYSNSELTQAMDALARNVNVSAIAYPAYQWKVFS